MNKKCMIVLLGAAAIITSVYASEGEPTKSAGTQLAEMFKTSLSFVSNTIKGTANCPNTIAHYFGYGKEMKTWKQFFIALAFWAALSAAVKKAYEFYNDRKTKKQFAAIVNDVTSGIENDDLYEIQN